MAAVRTDNNDKMMNAVPKIGGPIRQQPTFNWEAEDKYRKLKNFIQEVNNIIESYNMLQTGRITITKNWLGRKGLQFLEALKWAYKERYNTSGGLFNTLVRNCITIPKINQQGNENTQEWMARLFN